MTTTEGYPSSMFVYKGDVVKEGDSVTPTEINELIYVRLHYIGKTGFIAKWTSVLYKIWIQTPSNRYTSTCYLAP